ncbi:protein of unknown function [Candidatus Promineifilum breve]|uniref:Uncharacterized protein n=1 Tax=Candidatus Promineifilum breve TaxID=1806508 RepID=A0A160T712_9CHLR|nr:protein of unknown function [Candidatus Promineifilum breve]
MPRILRIELNPFDPFNPCPIRV